MSKTNYRSDIDGLRAVAVLLVVIFHAFPSAITGGFVGVDVFFVISGYLITGALRNGLEKPYYGIKQFYIHRIRRLFPALITICIATIVMGWFILMPDEYVQLGHHLTAGSLFFENFRLLLEAGYFDIESESKPLMHLWSLSVEEQFYLIFPLLVIACAKASWRLDRAIVVLTITSLAACAWYSLHAPSQGYFLPQSRFWEILCGALLQQLTYKNTSSNAKSTAHFTVWDFAGLFGVLSIIGCAFLITPNTPFPFPSAIPAVAGSALIIWAGQRAWINREVLGSRPMVAIGLISYPLYLWHWPLLSFLHIAKSGRTSDADRLMAVLLSIALAWATYKLIETPLRYRWKSHKAPQLLALGMVLISLLGAYIDHRKGLSFRTTSRVNAQYGETSHGSLKLLKESNNLAFGCGVRDEAMSKTVANCLHDTREVPTVAIIGDSKSEALAGSLVSTSEPGYRMLYIGGTNANGALVPVISSNPIYGSYQAWANTAIDSLANNPSLRVVVYVVATRALFKLKAEDSIEDLPTSPNAEVVYDGLNASIKQLTKTGKKVVIVVDNPTLPDPKKCIGRITGIKMIDTTLDLGEGTGCSIDLTQFQSQRKPYLDVLYRIQKNSPDGAVTIFDTIPHLCDIPTGKCSSIHNGRLLYSYSDHISDSGGIRIAKHLVPLIREIATR